MSLVLLSEEEVAQRTPKPGEGDSSTTVRQAPLSCLPACSCSCTVRVHSMHSMHSRPPSPALQRKPLVSVMQVEVGDDSSTQPGGGPEASADSYVEVQPMPLPPPL